MTEAGSRQNYNPSQLPRTDEATAPETPRNRGKRIVVMALKLLAFLLLTAGALLIGALASFEELELAIVIAAAIVMVVGLALLAGAAGVYRYAHRLERETAAQHSPTSTNPATAEGLPYPPLPGEGWREAQDWELFRTLCQVLPGRTAGWGRFRRKARSHPMRSCAGSG